MPKPIETPTWWPKPKKVQILFANHVGSSSADEVVVSVMANGGKQDILVPRAAIDTKRSIVPGVVVGEMGNQLLVTLPSGSMGTSNLLVDKEAAKTVFVNWREG